MIAPQVHVAIYDGGCKVCSDFAALLRRLVPPQALDVVPCGSAIQKKLAPSVDVRDCLQDFTLFNSSGRSLRGVDAVREALLLSPKLSRLRPLFESRLGRFAAELIHLGARRRRAKKGCCGGKKAVGDQSGAQ